MFDIRPVDNDAQREMINIRDRYKALRAERVRFERDFAAKMFFRKSNGAEYLAKRLPTSKGGSEKSLGPRSAETEKILADYEPKRAQSKALIKGIDEEINKRRRLITARGAGRIPYAAGEVLRRLDRAGWLGTRLLVAGTNALFAYEATAAVWIDEGVVATDDVDILNDARRRIVFTGDTDDSKGFIGALQKADKSFHAVAQGDFRAINNAGFVVDLITPHPLNRDALSSERSNMARKNDRLSDHEDDLQPVAIDGLQWLINAPRFEDITFDTRGYPVWIPTIDPRVFAAHKLWLSQRSDRDQVKRRRDRNQAIAAAVLATEYLGLSFDDNALTAAPRVLIDGIGDLQTDIDAVVSRLD